MNTSDQINRKGRSGMKKNTTSPPPSVAPARDAFDRAAATLRASGISFREVDGCPEPACPSCSGPASFALDPAA